MKTIAIDITHYERMSGYGVVTRNIVKGLLQADPDNFYVLISHTHQNVENLKEFKNRKFVNTNENFTLYKFFTLPKYLKKHNVEVFLSLDQTLPFKKVCKYLIVEHDIVYQRMGKRNLLKNFFMNKHIRRLTFLYYFLDFEKLWLKKADTIITPSQFTKEELIQYYHIRPEKINVVYRGMDYTFYSNKQYKKKNQILFPFPSLHSDFAFKLANELLEKRIIESIVMTKP
ncbi:MAG: glycosyltransferase [Candidatus Peribacteria bacterium]|jgi:glycosyltransferase involved in cell wall biosynthesis|nr:glycosyltransferase [Candidatus Peribacteria bacterium]